MNLIARVYAALLQLYPKRFCELFGEEMQAVFVDALQDAARTGHISLALLLGRELLELPVSIAAEHWRERSRRTKDWNSLASSRFKPVSGLGIPAALTPFLGAAVFGSGSQLGPDGLVAYALFAGMIAVFALGLIRRIPSWSLPTIGFCGTIFALPALALWAPVFIFLPDLANWMRLWIGSGFPWFSLCVISVSLILVMALKRAPLYERIRRDWIWLAFAFYGSAAYWLLLTFDEYVGTLPYVAGASAVLVLGALLFVRASRPWVRFVILLGSLLLAILIVTWGKWNLVPTQTWPLNINDELRWGETQSSLITGVWLVLAVLGAPAFARLLPRPRGQSPRNPI